MLALPAKIHIFRPRLCDKSHSFGKCARRILEATLGKSVILPRFIKLFECNVTLPAIKSRLSSSDTPSLRRVKLRLPSGNGVEKYRFSTSLSDFFNVPTAPQRLRSAALRLYEQTFHFYTKDMFAYPFTIFVRRAMLCRCFL